MHKRENREEQGPDVRESESFVEDGAGRGEQALDAQELDSVVEDGDVYEGPDGRCVMCHARERDLIENSQSMLCAECRQKCLALRVPMGIRIFLVLVCAVFLLSVCLLPPVLDTYKTYLTAGRQMQAREYAFAYQNYAGLLEEYSGSVTIALKAADAALSAQYLPQLGQTLDEHLVGKPLNDADYNRAMAFVNVLDFYGLTYEKIEGAIEQANKDVPDQASKAYGDAISARCAELLTQGGIDKTQVYYVMGSVASDDEESASYLKLATEQDPKFTYPYANYGTALRRLGKLDEAKGIYDKALSLNACDAQSMRGLGVLLLLQGDTAEGLAKIQRAYAIEPDDLYIADALVVALNENGQREEALKLRNELAAQGVEFEADLGEYLDGKLSLEQYYIS
jgi:tetratricopeptide (TPR) repeat protein